jgi:monoamine oxidase
MRLPSVRELLEAQLASAGPAEEVSLLSVLEFLRGVGGVEGLRTSRHSVVRGGAFQLSERLAASIGESLILDSPVRSIEQSSTGVVVRADTIEAHAEVVIVAIAPPLAELIEFTPALPARRRLLQQRWAQAPSIKITAVYPAPWWRERGFSGRAITDLPVAPVLLDASPSDGSTGVIVSMSSAAQPPPAWVIEDSARRKAQFFEALTCLFGAGPPEPIAYLEANWFGHRWIAGCGQMLPCGVLSGLGDTLRPPVGRVVWAGSEVSERWAAYLDGAVRAAEDAVAQARRLLGSTGAETATPTLTHNRR